MRLNGVNSPERANWVNAVKNKQNGKRLLTLSAPVGAGGCPRRLAPRTGPSILHGTDHVLIMFM